MFEKVKVALKRRLGFLGGLIYLLASVTIFHVVSSIIDVTNGAPPSVRLFDSPPRWMDACSFGSNLGEDLISSRPLWTS
jgi:hypothetical protein